MQDTRRDPSRADQVHDRLLADIVAGTYPLQSRLPPEEVLAQTCGVSRPVLRMALARLREDGIITSRRGSGNYVTRRPDRAVMDFVPLGSITDIRRCYEFRADVESAAAAWAARRRTEADLAAMEAAQALLAGSYRQQQLGVEADHQLHLAVARASGNPFYVTVLESLATQIAFGMTLSRSLTLQGAPDRQAKVEAEHRALIEAIRAADPEAAAAAMRRHVIAARDRMFEGGD
ncbi:MAG: FadR/GntR family transcriptional regulator [Salipiger marinus]|uniref:FadR/GntR family transcriptional regulator n=1 Tax=Salipiger marinus TaxID=555512 RepID=UPI004058749D